MSLSLTSHFLIDAADAAFPLTIDPVATSPSCTATGEATNNELGISVGTAGDVNDDNYTAVILGASGFDTSRRRAHVYHGQEATTETIAATHILTPTEWGIFILVCAIDLFAVWDLRLRRESWPRRGGRSKASHACWDTRVAKAHPAQTSEVLKTSEVSLTC